MKKSFGLLLLSMTLGGAYYGFNRPAPAPEKAAGKGPVPVKVAEVRVQDQLRWLDVVGYGEASETVTVKARVDGQVASVAYREGAFVARGEPLAQLDPADFNAKLAVTVANLARGEAHLAKARADLTRYLAITTKGFVAEEKVSEMRANVQDAEAALKADQAAVDLARLQLSYTHLRAPIEGRLGIQLVFPGTTVKTNETPLAVINRIQPLQVRFSIAERYLPMVQSLLKAGPMGVRVNPISDATRYSTGTISFIDHSVDTATGTIQLKATLANADAALTPGQFMQVRLGLGVWPQAALVPAEAVQQGPQGAFVFVVQDDQTLTMRPVELAESRDEVEVITRGLSAGDIVVIDGHVRLTPKSTVKVVATAPRPADHAQP